MKSASEIETLNVMQPTFDRQRFFVALLPPAEVQQSAEALIQELGDRYSTRTAKAPPHVTLQPPFEWSVAEVAPLEASLHEFASGQNSVLLTIAGFGAFAPRVLYLNVVKSPQLMVLQAQLANWLEQQFNIVDAVGKQRGFTPHLTIASRNLTRSTFRQAWADLQSRPVDFEFMSDRLTLLIHDGQQWQVRSEFALQVVQ